MKKISGIFIIVLLVFISLTFCEKPDPILLAIQSDYKFPPIKHPEDINPNNLPEYLNPGLTYESITDIEGNTYRTIQIGTQTWMAENLRTTKFKDGNKIHNGIFGWNTKTGAYLWYNNDASGFKNTYGALYNWYAVNTGRLCPAGWHVPSDDERKQLEIELGMT